MVEELKRWADKYVPIFNSLSEKYRTGFYTQSPLDVVCEPVEQMIIGINPKGNVGGGVQYKSPEDYLRGNYTSWPKRFEESGNIHPAWQKFLGGTRTFLGYIGGKSCDAIDDDTKTVWTNLSPFMSDNGFADLPRELMEEGLKSTMELIKILRPKRIILLTRQGFNALDKANVKLGYPVEHTRVIDTISFEIGNICGIPAVSVSHPSGKWGISRCFIPMFLLLHKLNYVDGLGRIATLSELKAKMRKELSLWLSQIPQEAIE